ncbi:MAG: hypothetical protein ACI8XM_001987 [Haloarculaceae archaeon]|jgi:hypothetical protein
MTPRTIPIDPTAHRDLPHQIARIENVSVGEVTDVPTRGNPRGMDTVVGVALGTAGTELQPPTVTGSEGVEGISKL